MTKKKALLKDILIMASVLACMAALLLPFRNDPPAADGFSEDAGEYMEVNWFVEKALTDEFAPVLPQQIPADATAERYVYRYSRGMFGDPAFFIDLALRFDGDEAFSQEYERLQSLGVPKTVQLGGVEYLLFACDPKSVASYFDDKIYDGLVLPFNLAAVDRESRTIEYMIAHVQDGSLRYARLSDLLTLLESADEI